MDVNPMKATIEFAFPHSLDQVGLVAAFHLGLHIASFHPEVGAGFISRLDPAATEIAEDLVNALIVHLSMAKVTTIPGDALRQAHI